MGLFERVRRRRCFAQSASLRDFLLPICVTAMTLATWVPAGRSLKHGSNSIKLIAGRNAI